MRVGCGMVYGFTSRSAIQQTHWAISMWGSSLTGSKGVASLHPEGLRALTLIPQPCERTPSFHLACGGDRDAACDDVQHPPGTRPRRREPLVQAARPGL